MSTLYKSPPEVVHLQLNVADRFRRVIAMAQEVGAEPDFTESLERDRKIVFPMWQRYSRGDYRHRDKEILAAEGIVRWVVHERMRLMREYGAGGGDGGLVLPG